MIILSKIFRACLRAAAIFVFLASIYIILQWFGWHFAVVHSLPIIGLSLAILLPILMYAFYAEKRAWFRQCAGWAEVVSIPAIFVSASREIWFMAIVAVLGVWIFQRQASKRFKVREKKGKRM